MDPEVGGGEKCRGYELVKCVKQKQSLCNMVEHKKDLYVRNEICVKH